MSPQHFPQLLGRSTTDETLLQALAAHAAGNSHLAPAKVQKLKSDFLMLESLGIVFSFSSRQAFERDYGTPKGEGDRILSAIFYYPDGSDEVDPYEGPGPMSDIPVETRTDALAAYGEPAESEAEDDDIEWEQWLIEGVEISADYDEHLDVLTLTASLPMAL